ncbi:hypothetical protein E1A91_A07G105400v1 [Gossypium mustelinum]|uniref:Uncharacterized protein n=1 Tax=Gossypium mustelinum TaxID=34275 RepID=A0A5D2YJN9_GOSMU|nr:hypothetical protein E1A91_A07G105400v1 [Gossypium mustelinum]
MVSDGLYAKVRSVGHALALGLRRTEARTWLYGVEGTWRLGLLRRKVGEALRVSVRVLIFRACWAINSWV